MNKEQLRAAVEARLNQIESALSTVDDEAAINLTTLFPRWEPDISYDVGKRLQYNNKLYKVIQAHTSQINWTPDQTPALFAEIAAPGEIAEWRQPYGSEDAYHIGDRVQYNGVVWESTIDNNIWAPGVYGWTQI